jgi:hypothetical protein
MAPADSAFWFFALPIQSGALAAAVFSTLAVISGGL